MIYKHNNHHHHHQILAWYKMIKYFQSWWSANISIIIIVVNTNHNHRHQHQILAWCKVRKDCQLISMTTLIIIVILNNHYHDVQSSPSLANIGLVQGEKKLPIGSGLALHQYHLRFHPQHHRHRISSLMHYDFNNHHHQQIYCHHASALRLVWLYLKVSMISTKFRDASSQFLFYPFYIVDFPSARSWTGRVKIFNVRMVTTELARGIHSICQILLDPFKLTWRLMHGRFCVWKMCFF